MIDPRERDAIPMTMAQIEAISVAGAELLNGPVELCEYDDEWPLRFDREAARIRSALGASVIALEHVGSTAVPGLAAKPIIDIHLVVADSAREELYAPRLEEIGYALVIREPDWFEHRMFRSQSPRANLHVFSPGCPEVERVRLFRDHLRASREDRDLYAATKRRLAGREWRYLQNYADAKHDVIAEIMTRATPRAAQPDG
jgi:GrpB-like predicted nucleotidyltransferase (UPF0157 family)